MKFESFKKILETEVNERGVTGVANALGVSRQAVYYWLSGEREIGYSTYIKLLRLYESRISG